MDKIITYSPGRAFLTVKDMQKMFHVSRQTIWDWRNEGMPYYKIRAAVRFDYEEVMNWVKAHHNGNSSCRKN